MRIWLAFLVAASCYGADLEFVGVMANGKDTFFALRDLQTATSRWVPVGGEVAGFVVRSYDATTDSLTVERANERMVLKLPESHVKMARDEVIEGLAKILGVSEVTSVFQLVHPKLRPLFTAADLDASAFRGILAGASKVEIREIPDAFASALSEGLSEVEKAIGTRPKYGLWVEGRGQLSMSFVVKVGNSWLLAPCAPHVNH